MSLNRLNDNAPPVRVLVSILGFTALILGATFALLFITPVNERPDVYVRLGTVVPVALAAIPGILAWLSGREGRQQITNQLSNLEHLTNGNTANLIERNRGDDEEAAVRFLTRLKAEGVNVSDLAGRMVDGDGSH